MPEKSQGIGATRQACIDMRGARLTLVCACLLAGCAVGPDYKQPAAPPGKGYAAESLAKTETVATLTAGGNAQKIVTGLDIPGQWWTLYHSTTLNQLINEALAHSPTLEAAQAALRAANETAAAGLGSFLPALSAGYTPSRQKFAGVLQGLSYNPIYTLYGASVSVSYTLDVFGGTRRQQEQLNARAEYQQFALEASYLSLTSNIVTAAVNEAALRAQIAATEDIVQTERAQLDIIQRQVEVGAASRADLLQQQATLASTEATLPGLRSQLQQRRNQLATYVGKLPADYDGAPFKLDDLSLPETLPASLPSQLVAQRPDIRQYAAQLHEATANIGIATANMLPNITLTGSYGTQAFTMGQLFSPSSLIWSLASQITQPIFQGGALLHKRRAAVASAKQAAANYRGAVLTAFQNVSDVLYALQTDADALQASLAAEQAAAESLEIIKDRYRLGSDTYVQVLIAEQNYQNAVIALVKARAQRYSDTAALFQALGGGWWQQSAQYGQLEHKGK
jgi:NodT family efflux transporter outer membrane factor (OMF) lipoprotein